MIIKTTHFMFVKFITNKYTHQTQTGTVLDTLRRMALAFALIKQMLKLEKRSKEACDFGRDLWIASRAATCAKTMKSLYPKPHRNQLLEGLRPTLELNTFHRWPGVSCSPLPQGLHQTLFMILFLFHIVSYPDL